VQEGHGSEHIPMRLHDDMRRRKNLRQEFLGREGRKAPVLAPVIHVPAGDLADAVAGSEQHPTGLQDAVQRT